MALPIAFYDTAGQSLSVSIVRGDGLKYDFTDATFKSSPTTLTAAMTASTGVEAGEYLYLLASTPAVTFPSGEYRIRIHDAAGIRAGLMATCWSGDFSMVIVGFDPRVRIVP